MDGLVGSTILGLLPVALLIGAWIFFMVIQKRTPGNYEESVRRQADALERIATALEKRQ